MLETAAETAGLSQEQLADRAGETEETRFLTDKAIQAAADTIWPEGVRAIGRAYAAGLLAKDKPVLDIRLRVLGIMKDLDELHVRLLELLVRYEPDIKNNSMLPSRSAFPPTWTRIWEEIARIIPRSGRSAAGSGRPMIAARPEIEPVLPSLLGELRERGLAQENDTAPEAVKRLTEDLAKQVNRQAGQTQGARERSRSNFSRERIRLLIQHGHRPSWARRSLVSTRRPGPRTHRTRAVTPAGYFLTISTWTPGPS